MRLPSAIRHSNTRRDSHWPHQIVEIHLGDAAQRLCGSAAAALFGSTVPPEKLNLLLAAGRCSRGLGSTRRDCRILLGGTWSPGVDVREARANQFLHEPARPSLENDPLHAIVNDGGP